MTIPTDQLASLPAPFLYALMFAIGIALGFIFLHALRTSVRLLVEGGNLIVIFAIGIGRFAFAAGIFYLASRLGAVPLLAVALGFGVARVLGVMIAQRVSS